MTKKIVGIDLGGSSIKAAVVTFDGGILTKGVAETMVSEGREKVAKRISTLIRELTRGETGIAVGIGSPGSVDRKKGIVRFSPNFPDWNHFPLKDRIEEATGCPTYVENDAKAAALGEKWFGLAKGIDHFLVITLGTGVGGGIMSHGQLITGADGMGGELGHVNAIPDGALCGCGSKGCLETVASNTGMRRMALEGKNRFPNSLIFELSGDSRFGAREIFLAYSRKDRLAELIVRQFCSGLGRAIGSFVNIFNPRLVILTGGISQAAPFFLEEVVNVANEHVFLSLMHSFEVRPSDLRENAAILGAASVALENLSIRL